MLDSRLQNWLARNATLDLDRQRYTVAGREDGAITIQNETLINFSSNDYLNISQHEGVKKAYEEGVRRYGLGSGASALVSGYSVAHQQLEEAFAKFINRPKALLFNSGYHANLGVLTTFANKNTVIVADKLCHASLTDGALLTRATYRRYRHNDVEHAKEIIEKSNKQPLLISESVFSMEGDIAKISHLAQLAKEYQAMLMVDDAHGIGVLGQQGKGISEHFQLNTDAIPCLITPLGKALGGLGAIVSGTQDVIEALVQLARTYRYTTALPAALCHAMLSALKIIEKESWRRQQLQSLVRFFIKECHHRQLVLSSEDETPIKSIVIGSSREALLLQKKLYQHHFFVACIRPPTVPPHTARLRISLNCVHTEQHITQLLDLIKENAFSK